LDGLWRVSLPVASPTEDVLRIRALQNLLVRSRQSQGGRASVSGQGMRQESQGKRGGEIQVVNKMVVEKWQFCFVLRRGFKDASSACAHNSTVDLQNKPVVFLLCSTCNLSETRNMSMLSRFSKTISASRPLSRSYSVHGRVEPAFEAVKEAFREQFADGRHDKAQVS